MWRYFAIALALASICNAFAPGAVAPLRHFTSRQGVFARDVTLSGRAGRARAAALKRPLEVVMGAEYDILSGVTVTSVSTGASMPLTSAWKKNNGKALVVLLTHFGDLTCWEYAQKLRYYLPQLEAQGVQVRMVGIGGAEAASEFAESNSIPKELLYYDPDASAAAALGLNPGFGRKSGSPGTMSKVLYGYFGDRNSNPEWIPAQLKFTQKGSFPYVDPDTFATLGTGYLRPFELATVRLQNMVSVLNRWEALIPDNQDLVVQQGGTLVFDDEKTAYRYDDKGILVYAPIEEVLAAAAAGSAVPAN